MFWSLFLYPRTGSHCLDWGATVSCSVTTTGTSNLSLPGGLLFPPLPGTGPKGRRPALPSNPESLGGHQGALPGPQTRRGQAHLGPGLAVGTFAVIRLVTGYSSSGFAVSCII